MAEYVDLHVHPLEDWTSVYKDRAMLDHILEKSAGEFITTASERGIKAFAVTDHNSVHSIPKMTKLGKTNDIEIIPGIEYSLSILGHTLAYFIDYERLGTDMENGTVKRLVESVALKFYDRVDKRYRPKEATKTHGARDRAGFIAGLNEDDKVECFRDLIAVLHSYGGVVIKAHIFQNDELWNEPIHGSKSWVEPLINAGIDGFEVHTPRHTAEQAKYLMEMLQGTSCIITGGSDAHSDNAVGCIEYSDNRQRIDIDYSIVKQLKEAKRKLHQGKRVDFETGKVIG